MKFRDRSEILESEFGGGGAVLELVWTNESTLCPLPNCTSQVKSVKLRHPIPSRLSTTNHHHLGGFD